MRYPHADLGPESPPVGRVGSEGVDPPRRRGHCEQGVQGGHIGCLDARIERGGIAPKRSRSSVRSDARFSSSRPLTIPDAINSSSTFDIFSTSSKLAAIGASK